MAVETTVLKSSAGIKRDGTRFDGDFYTDGQWVRFQRGLPRKIGGVRSIQKFLTEISRGFHTFTQQGLIYCHSGGASTLERFTVDGTRNSSVVSNRTPTSFPSSAANRWMFQTMYNSSSPGTSLLAHVSPNGNCICNDDGGAIYAGDVLGTAALTAVSLPSGANATGGIVALHPYLVYYGTEGVVGWSVAGNPTDLSGTGSGIARAWGQKIIKGLPLRAGFDAAPAGILWAYDAVLRMSFSGGESVFNFDVLATDTSIMSADSVVDYDGVFFWAGVDRFLMFNGVVREVPNSLSTNWFFNNLNPSQRSKVFAVKVPYYGEIWWCYPRGSATECTHAVIYNVRENTWYDTALPEDNRSAASFSTALAAPVMVGATQHVSGVKVWLHEQGSDVIDGTSIEPIASWFETADLSAVAKGKNRNMRIVTIEPDFVQNGPMSVQVTGRANARAPEVSSTRFMFPESAAVPHEQIVMLKEQRRELRVRFESNTIGGDYQMGQIIAHLDTGDGTVLA